MIKLSGRIINEQAIATIGLMWSFGKDAPDGVEVVLVNGQAYRYQIGTADADVLLDYAGLTEKTRQIRHLATNGHLDANTPMPETDMREVTF
jgi:hypothetical protein